MRLVSCRCDAVAGSLGQLRGYDDTKHTRNGLHCNSLSLSRAILLIVFLASSEISVLQTSSGCLYSSTHWQTRRMTCFFIIVSPGMSALARLSYATFQNSGPRKDPCPAPDVSFFRRYLLLFLSDLFDFINSYILKLFQFQAANQRQKHNPHL